MLFSVRRSLAWMAMSQASLFVLQFGGSVIVARLLTPYDMGVFALATAIAGVISILRSIGLGSYLVRAPEIDEAMLASVFTVNAVLCGAVSAAVAAAGVLGGLMLSEPGVRDVLLVLALVPLIGIFDFLPATGMERSGNFRLIGLVNLGRSAVSIGVLLAFAFSGFSYLSLAYGQVAGAIYGAALLNLRGRQHIRLRLGLRDWRDIARYGCHVLAISGLNSVSGRLAEVVLSRVLGLTALGLYSRAGSLNSILWENIHNAIGRIVFVEFSQQRRRGISLRETYLRIVQMVTALLWPAFTGMSILAGPLVLTLYGPNWVEAALPLSLLSLSAAVLVSITMIGELFVVCQETGRQARFEFVRAGVGFTLFAGGCFLGLGWAAAARIGEALFTVALYRPHLQRMTGTTGRDFVGIYASSAVLTLVAVAPAAAVMSLHGWHPQVPPLQVLASVAAGIAGWVLLLVATRHPLAREGQMFLARLRPGRIWQRAD